MESILGAGDRDSRRAVIRSGITLAEVVGLDRSIIGADLLLFSSVSLNLDTSNKNIPVIHSPSQSHRDHPTPSQRY